MKSSFVATVNFPVITERWNFAFSKICYWFKMHTISITWGKLSGTHEAFNTWGSQMSHSMCDWGVPRVHFRQFGVQSLGYAQPFSNTPPISWFCSIGRWW